METNTVPPTIHCRIGVKKSYEYLWLKYVNGFSSATHCYNCLIGSRSNITPIRGNQNIKKSDANYPYPAGKVFEMNLDEAAYKYIYLCGVTPNYNDNLHVVVRYKQGNTVTHEDKYCKVVMTNCERVAIPPITKYIDRPMECTTCRNFQFGYAYLSDTDPYSGKSWTECRNKKVIESK